MAKHTESSATEEQAHKFYQENLRAQAESILRSWGEPDKKRRRGQKLKTRPSGVRKLNK